MLTHSDITARDYLFTPSALDAKQVEYLRRHRVDYSGPGKYAGISQHECFEGRVNVVHVHPSFPAEPVMTHDGVFGFGYHMQHGRPTLNTSSRRAAIELAKVQRSKPDTNARAYRPDVAKLMCDAAIATIDFLNRFTNDRGEALTGAEGYEAAAKAMYAAVSWDSIDDVAGSSGGILWPNVWAAALNFPYKSEYGQWMRASCYANSSRTLVDCISWNLRRMGDQGLIANAAVTGLQDALAAARGQ